MLYGPICCVYHNKQLYGAMQILKQVEEIQVPLVDFVYLKFIEKRFNSIWDITETQT